jgi:hypothetical protein
MKTNKIIPSKQTKCTENLLVPKHDEADSSLVNVDPNERHVGYPPFRIRLNSIENTRKSQANIVRAFAHGKITADTARALSFTIQTLLAAFRVESELTVMERLEALTRRVKEIGDGKD